LNQMALLLTIWNLILLIIAIATEFSVFPLNDWLNMAPACLLSALICMTFLMLLPLAGIGANKKPEQQAVYLPHVFPKAVITDLLIASAFLSVVVLAFAVANLVYLIGVQQISEIDHLYGAGAAFTILFFFSALIGMIMSIIALVPSDTPSLISSLVAWVFHLLSFVMALIAFILQGFTGIYFFNYQILIPLLGWIFGLATFCVAIAAHYMHDSRAFGAGDCCNPSTDTPELVRERELASIEKAKRDKAQYAKERTDFEGGITQV